MDAEIGGGMQVSKCRAEYHKILKVQNCRGRSFRIATIVNIEKCMVDNANQ